MKVTSDSNQDRRAFFRINDSVVIDFSVIDDKELPQRAQTLSDEYDDEAGHLQQQLAEMNTAITHLIDQVNQSNREVARSLRLIDDKINIIAQSLQRQQKHLDIRPQTSVNLSGGGISFVSEQQFAEKTALEVKIDLQHSATSIHAIANVVSCTAVNKANKDPAYLLRLVFSHMTEQHRSALIKHTLSRQAQNLRQQSQQNNNDG